MRLSEDFFDRPVLEVAPDLLGAVVAHRTATGTAFRDAHEITGRLVRHCDEHGLELWEVDDDGLRTVDDRLSPDVRSVLSVRGALESRSTHGGTAPARVAEQLSALADAAHGHAAWARGG